MLYSRFEQSIHRNTITKLRQDHKHNHRTQVVSAPLTCGGAAGMLAVHNHQEGCERECDNDAAVDVYLPYRADIAEADA